MNGLSGNYFDAMSDFSKVTWAKAPGIKTVLALKVASLFTIVIPLFVAAANLCLTGNLLGRVKVAPKSPDDGAGKLYKKTIGQPNDPTLTLNNGGVGIGGSLRGLDDNDEESLLDHGPSKSGASDQPPAVKKKPQSSTSGYQESKKVQDLEAKLQQAQKQAATTAAQLNQLAQENTALKEKIALNAKSQNKTPLPDGNQELAALQQQSAEMKQTLEAVTSELKKLEQTSKELQSKLEEAKKREADAHKRADKLIARTGQSHIHRDWQQSNASTVFPVGEDIKMEFTANFLNFDSFAWDVVNILEKADKSEVEDEVKTEQATTEFIHGVMTPLFTKCQDYVSDYIQSHKEILQKNFGIAIDENNPETKEKVSTLFWYQAMQPMIVQMVNSLTDEKIDAILGEDLLAMHKKMVAAEKEGTIADGETNLRIPKIARSLLRLMALGALSDPACYLSPAPGERIKFKEGFTSEVLSPGAKIHGRIKEGDEVEVVMGGLFIEKLTEANRDTLKPMCPSFVRRIIK